MALPRLHPGDIDHGIYDLSQVPMEGASRLRDACTIAGAPRQRVLQRHLSKYKRELAAGRVPTPRVICGLEVLDNAVIHAFVKGHDWRAVEARLARERAESAVAAE